MKTIIRFVLTALLVMLLAYLLPGVSVGGFGYALLTALVLAILDSLVKPILVFLSIPATFITFGLFLFVINAIIILLASWVIGSNFQVDNFWWALLFSILLSFGQSLVGIDKDSRKAKKNG